MNLKFQIVRCVRVSIAADWAFPIKCCGKNRNKANRSAIVLPEELNPLDARAVLSLAVHDPRCVFHSCARL
jgi:hypothetical protein